MVDFKEDGVKFSQTTKGVWYVSEIAIHTDKIMEAIEMGNKAMIKCNRYLGQRNRMKAKKD
jgi:hypothetical protein